MSEGFLKSDVKSNFGSEYFTFVITEISEEYAQTTIRALKTALHFNMKSESSCAFYEHLSVTSVSYICNFSIFSSLNDFLQDYRYERR